MHLLKAAMPIALSSFIFISCNDEIINNYISGDIGVNIIDGDYELVSLHRTYINPDYPGISCFYGADITLILDDSANRGNIHKLVITSEKNTGYEFDREELEEFYVDSIGGYILRTMPFSNAFNTSRALWNIKLYNNSNESSNGYPLGIKLYNYFIIEHECVYTTNSGNLTVDVTDHFDEITSAAKAETHFFNSGRQEISVYKSAITSKKWTATVPAGAAYFSYIITDSLSGVKRKFYSAQFALNEIE